ncbi:TPM domain-containing protein [Hydrocarboniphaga sp.]|uniref:TPM domain-containing protein n=1 Tax=Hydrocarboniphaga sp. TaxID=2033016 RepID=UPI003D0C426A
MTSASKGSRLWRHLLGARATRRHFPAAVLADIEAATKRCEGQHPGEIRFIVEAALPVASVLAGTTPRQRAVELFAHYGVWDTEHNNGVLIYVLLADRDVEIVADRGVADGRVPPAEWEACCRIMEQHYAAGRYSAGSVAGIEAVAAVLAKYPPERADAGNELPDAPIVI